LSFPSSTKGCEGLESFTTRDGERAGLVRAGEAAGALGDVEDGALGGAKRFITELRIADVGGLDGEQELDGDLVCDEAVVRELRRRALVDHALTGAAMEKNPAQPPPGSTSRIAGA